MITDRYAFFQGYPPSFFQTPKEEINSHIASLTNENIYEFLRRYFDSSRTEELEDIDSMNLLQEDSFGQTMLHWAAIKGDKEVAKFIIKKTGHELFNSRTKMDQYTALHLAVHGGNCEVLALLIDESKSRGLSDLVDVADIHGQTALHLAASRGNADACRILYQAMSPSAITLQIPGRLQTALHFAVHGGYYDIVQMLISNDEISKEFLGKVDEYGQSVLHWAAGKPSDQGFDIANLLMEKALELPSDICKNFFLAKKREGYTALHIAVHSNSNRTIASLVNATKGRIPEFISATDDYGQTALHWAAGRGNLEASKCLCNAMEHEKINIRMKDRLQTALHFAVQGGYTDIVKLLVEKGADIGLKDFNQHTPLDWAKILQVESRESIIKLLEQQIRDPIAE